MYATKAFGLVLAAALLASAGPASGQTPMGTAFTYQGHLMDNGNPANGQYDFEFKLCDDPAAACEVDASTVAYYEDDKQVDDGLFTVEIDFGSDVFNGQARWLELGVRPGASSGADPYTTLSPRQELTPTPHALALPGLWTQQNATSPNLVGGYAGNNVMAGACGATVGGGGSDMWPNRVTDSYGTVGGGALNRAGDDDTNAESEKYATVGGGYGNTASAFVSTVGGGLSNAASSEGSTVGGGKDNVAYHKDSTVGGGYANTASEEGSTVGGGIANVASGWYATVGGGLSNAASAEGSTVGAGERNDAIGDVSTVGGGDSNTASGVSSTIAGGYYNWAEGLETTIGGGYHNNARGVASTVPGGLHNTAAGDYSFAAGVRAEAMHTSAFVWADSTDADFTSTGPDQFLIRASGGVGIGTTAPAEQLDVAGTAQMAGFKMPTGASAGHVLTSDSGGVGTWQPASGTTGLVPIGVVIAWAKSLTGVPGLPDTWVECNGQALSDPDSPLNGQTIPDLNGTTGTQRFLRGSSSSGTAAGSETHNHSGTTGIMDSGGYQGNGSNLGTLRHTHDFTTSTANHLPPYYEVVWIMKVK